MRARDDQRVRLRSRKSSESSAGNESRRMPRSWAATHLDVVLAADVADDDAVRAPSRGSAAPKPSNTGMLCSRSCVDMGG